MLVRDVYRSLIGSGSSAANYEPVVYIGRSPDSSPTDTRGCRPRARRVHARMSQAMSLDHLEMPKYAMRLKNRFPDPPTALLFQIDRHLRCVL
jgi:hypothetical protein